MANPEHVAVVRAGADAIAEWRVLTPGVDFDLEGAELKGTDLSRANLANSNLQKANLNLAKFHSTDLTGADLRSATLVRADLAYAHLRDADLSQTSLHWANLFRCEIGMTNFRDAYFHGTVMCDLDLSNALNLESAVHGGPSEISVSTLFNSRGKIPEVFLRGFGVHETFITFLPSLIDSEAAIQYYSCFISYSHKDEEFCKRLHSRMRDEKMRVWYAPEDMPGGKKLHEEIDVAIRVHDKLLLVLSQESMKSKWVATEIRRARRREHQEEKRALFPIRVVPFEMIRDWELFNADEGIDLATEIREYFIPDFSDWKDHDSFEGSFQRLLKDLKNDEKPVK